MKDELNFSAANSLIDGKAGVTINRMWHPTTEGDMVMNLITRWGCIAGAPDGEDSAGRQRIRLQTAAELVQRATETVALACAEMERRGWMQRIPDDVWKKVEDAERVTEQRLIDENERWL